MKLSNIQSRILRGIKSFAKFLATGVKKTGAWLERNGGDLGYVVGFCICLAGAFWAAATAPLPVATMTLAIVGLVSLAETVD